MVFKNEVTKLNGIWTTVYTSVESEFRALLELETDRLVDTIGKVFESFQTGFHMMCEDKETDDPKEKMVQEELKINLETAEQILKGPMQQAYETLERDFSRVGFAHE